jgi:hypothetical protein
MHTHYRTCGKGETSAWWIASEVTSGPSALSICRHTHTQCHTRCFSRHTPVKRETPPCTHVCTREHAPQAQRVGQPPPYTHTQTGTHHPGAPVLDEVAVELPVLGIRHRLLLLLLGLVEDRLDAMPCQAMPIKGEGVTSGKARPTNTTGSGVVYPCTVASHVVYTHGRVHIAAPVLWAARGRCWGHTDFLLHSRS